MSTYERHSPVEDAKIPSGYTVTYHEIRGYDSPDKWYEVHDSRGNKLGDYGTRNRAITACIDDNVARNPIPLPKSKRKKS